MEQKNTSQKQKKTVYLILHNVRSIHNVGSIFRTADAVGVSKIYLTGITPTPVDRFGRKREDFHKTALGAEDTVPWEYKKSASTLIKELKKDSARTVAVEQRKNSMEYRKYKLTKRTAFIFGNEVGGIPPQIMKQCDSVVEIPMKGKKESLNVSVAVGIILYQFLNS